MYFGAEENKKYKFSLFSYTGLALFIFLFLVVDYFLTEPHFSLKIHFSGYPVLFLILFV